MEYVKDVKKKRMDERVGEREKARDRKGQTESSQDVREDTYV